MNRSILVRASCLTLVLVAATGCSTLPTQTWNSATASLETVAVSNPVLREDPLFRYRADQLRSANLIAPLPVGSVLSEVAKRSRESGLQTIDVSRHGKALQTELIDQLRKAGYVSRHAGEGAADAARDRFRMLKTVPSAALSGSDALLEISGEIGYTAAARGQPFQPTVWLRLRLVDRDGRILLQDRVLLNPEDTGEDAVSVYSGMESELEAAVVLEDTERANQLLADAIKIVAAEVIALIKGPYYVDP